MGKQQLLFIISQKSGVPNNYKKIEALIRAHFKPEEATIQITEKKHSVFEYAKAWAEKFGDRGTVYICGGDGAINEVANALYGTPTRMGVIPGGTANDFAKTLYGKQPFTEDIVQKLLDQAHQPKHQAIDLLRLNQEKVVVNSVSLGFDNLVLKQAYENIKKWPRIGSRAYPLAVVQSLFKDRSYPVEITLETAAGKTLTYRDDMVLSVFANAGFYGGGFNPAPHAVIDDGQGDFLYAKAMNLFAFLPLILRYEKGTHLNHPKVVSQRFKKARLKSTTGQPIHGNCDGDLFQAIEVEVELLPSALPFSRLFL